MHVVSNAKHARVYHKIGCPYEKRILHVNRWDNNEIRARKMGMQACSYCGGFKGSMRVNKNKIKMWEKKGLNITTNEKENSILVKGNPGTWKLVYDPDSCKFHLLHGNYQFNVMTKTYESTNGFHEQRGVRSSNLTVLFEYIISHDNALEIVKDDYRKLPRSTKKQKKYYNSAKKRARRNSIKRVYEIFETLEA